VAAAKLNSLAVAEAPRQLKCCFGGRRRSACAACGEPDEARGGRGLAQPARQPPLTGQAHGRCGAEQPCCCRGASVTNMLLGGRRRSACASYGELSGARGGQGQAQLARQPRLTGRARGHCGAAAERFPRRLGGGTAGRRPEWADGGGNWVPPRVNGGWNSPPPAHQGNRRRLGHDSPAGRERRQRLGRGPPAPPRRWSWTPPPQEGRRRLVTL